MKEVKPITYIDWLPVLISGYLTASSGFFMFLFYDLKLEKSCDYVGFFFLCFFVWMIGTSVEFFIRVFRYFRYVKKNKKEGVIK